MHVFFLYAQPAVFLHLPFDSSEHETRVVVVVVGLGVGSALHCLFLYSQPRVFLHVFFDSSEHEMHVFCLYAQPAVSLHLPFDSSEHETPPPDEEQVSPFLRSQQPVVPHGATRLLPGFK